MDFKEDFLQLVWKYQYFDRKNLTTTDGQALEILQAGHSNALEGVQQKLFIWLLWKKKYLNLDFVVWIKLN